MFGPSFPQNQKMLKLFQFQNLRLSIKLRMKGTEGVMNNTFQKLTL